MRKAYFLPPSHKGYTHRTGGWHQFQTRQHYEYNFVEYVFILSARMLLFTFFIKIISDFVSGEFLLACQPLPGRKSWEKTLNLKLGNPLSSGEHSFSVCVSSSPHVICHLCGILFYPSFLSNFKLFLQIVTHFLRKPPLSGSWLARSPSHFKQVALTCCQFSLVSLEEIVWKRWTQSIRDFS